MTYRLFIDDERYPIDFDWVICRNFDSVVECIAEIGLPHYISFDHDLGEGKNGHDIAKWIVDFCLDHNIKPEFEFYVHSQNPIGRENIEGLLNSFLKTFG